jgi:hypothetical protein
MPEANLPGHFQPRAACWRAPFPDHREQHRSREQGKHQHARAHSEDIMTHDAPARQQRWFFVPSFLIQPGDALKSRSYYQESHWA